MISSELTNNDSLVNWLPFADPDKIDQIMPILNRLVVLDPFLGGLQT